VDNYLDSLAFAIGAVTETRRSLQFALDTHAISDAAARDHVIIYLLGVFYDLIRFLENELNDQEQFCLAECTLACHIDCTQPGSGACCVLAGEQQGCSEAGETACAQRAGIFSPGFTCADVVCDLSWAACVTEFGAVTTCSEQRQFACEALGGLAYLATSCSELPSPDGACLYFDDGVPRCADSTPELCTGLQGDFTAGLFCASGACYHDVGGATRCVHTSRVDCGNLAGEFVPDNLCNGTTAPPTQR
jgi:hypothetical protein